MPQQDEITLGGRVAVVTGGSGGIGSALALRLADAGADVLVTYFSVAEDAEQTAEHIRTRGRRAAVAHADAGDPETPAAVVGRAEAELGPVDVLVAGAGTGMPSSWADLEVATWDYTMAVNVRDPFLLAQRVLPGMVHRGFGRVLLLSSVAAFTGGVIGPHYAASKSALHGLVHHLASRVAGDGVTVNALAPALIEGTRMLPAGASADSVPVGRLGSVDEQAGFALAMLTNGYLTNKIVTLDGGMIPR